jgi:prephenate dehydratase
VITIGYTVGLHCQLHGRKLKPTTNPASAAQTRSSAGSPSHHPETRAERGGDTTQPTEKAPPPCPTKTRGNRTRTKTAPPAVVLSPIHAKMPLAIPTRTPSVGYLGPASSYSHQAALQGFSQHANNPTFTALTTIGDIFCAVQSGQVTYGVVPFENSTNGSVVFTLDLFRSCAAEFPDIQVVDETYLTVHHSLLASTATGGVADVTRVYSHPQAFGQCERWLNAMLKGVERVDVSSTSKAAQIVASEPGSAAIASVLAADNNPALKVLARNIEDSAENTTRFFVLARKDEVVVDAGEGNSKMLLSFTVDHAQPGALCDSLQVFKEFGLNLTSICSRPSTRRHWNYVFFVEFEGHEAAENVQAALKELEKYTADMRVLGGYVNKQPKVKA